MEIEGNVHPEQPTKIIHFHLSQFTTPWSTVPRLDALAAARGNRVFLLHLLLLVKFSNSVLLALSTKLC